MFYGNRLPDKSIKGLWYFGDRPGDFQGFIFRYSRTGTDFALNYRISLHLCEKLTLRPKLLPQCSYATPAND